MRAWKVEEFGPYKEALSIGEAPEPELASDGVIIDVHATGVMYADLLNIAGQYQVQPPLPFIPGSEAAGEVLEAGPDSRFKPGDRVVTVNLMGGFAEKALGMNANTFPIPENMSYIDAACFCINYQTAYMGMIYRGRLKEGETVLVQAGASGVGIAAIQLAKALNCTVIATASTEAKLEACRQAGADHLINYNEADFVAEVKNLTGGQGVDVVFDPVGGDVFDKSTKCIAFEGRLLIIGFASGRIPEIPANRLLLKNADAIGVFFGNYSLYRNAFVHETLETLYDFHRKGHIKPLIYKEYPFEELPAALEAIESRQCHGKPVLVLK